MFSSHNLTNGFIGGDAWKSVPNHRGAANASGEFFQYNASTPVSSASGLNIRIELSNPHPDTPFLSGESLRGRVVLFSPREGPESKSLIQLYGLKIRAYFESRTMHEHTSVVPSQRGAPKTTKVTLRQEWHRGGFVESFLIQPSKGAAETLRMVQKGDGVAECAWPFEVILPSMVTVEDSSLDYPDLPNLPRSPPPSCRDNSLGSVQHILEVIAHLSDPRAGSTGEPSLDDYGALVSTENILVARTVFTHLPSPDTFTFPARLPGFAEQVPNLEGSPVPSGLADKVMWHKILRFPSLGGVLDVKTILDSSLAIQHTLAAAVPVSLCLSFAATKPSLFRSKAKPVPIIGLAVTLDSITHTRGGRGGLGAGRKFQLRSSLPLVTPQLPMNVLTTELAEPRTLDFQLRFDVTQAHASGKMGIVPSLKTPNVEREYFLVFTLVFGGTGSQKWGIAHVPVVVHPDPKMSPVVVSEIGDSTPPPAF